MKRYIITSATPGCNPNYSFLDSIKNYCQLNKATLLILPTQALYKKDALHTDLSKYGQILEKDYKLNNNIFISSLPINSQQADPITGLDRLTNKETSVIYASPKQRMKSVPSPSNDYPRVIMTPGSCTFSYKKNSKTSLVASKDHVDGAIIVEIENGSTYHFRQVQSDRHGSFIDLGLEYSQKGKAKQVKTAALIPGDWHTGYTEPFVKQGTLEMLAYFKPERLFLHDFFDGISVNHHIDHKVLIKSMMGSKNNLAGELLACAVELKQLANHVKEVVVVKSNHDEFLDRWLDEGNFIKDHTNQIIGLELALAKANGEDPLEYGIRKYQDLKNVKFLTCDDSYKVSKKDIECGQHGHLGPDGARGSAVSIEKSYGNAVIGHRHSPEIQRGTYVVGTSSYLKLSYNKGPSSWMHSHCVVYSNGSRQLLNFINKKWKA